jgi:hypothetical protein
MTRTHQLVTNTGADTCSISPPYISTSASLGSEPCVCKTTKELLLARSNDYVNIVAQVRQY